MGDIGDHPWNKNKEDTNMITWASHIPSNKGKQQSCDVISPKDGILT